MTEEPEIVRWLEREVGLLEEASENLSRALKFARIRLTKAKGAANPEPVEPSEIKKAIPNIEGAGE
jgi:hypothetical protein